MFRTRPALIGFALAMTAAVPGAFAQGPPPDPGRRAEFLAKYDRDGDGNLSREEIEAARADGNSPGQTAKQEKKPERPEASGAGEIKHDREIQQLLDRFDRDRDGVLDYQEMAALREAVRASRGRQAEGDAP